MVVISVRMMGVGGPEYLSAEDQSFSEHEQMLFTKAVAVAESFGKKVSLLVVPAGDVFAALAQGANSLEVDSVVSGLSTKMTAEDQAFHLGQAWEALPEPKRQFNFYVIDPNGEIQGVLHRAARAHSEPRRRATGAPVVAEHAPRSLRAGSASQRHHHLCPHPAGRPVCPRESRRSCATCATIAPPRPRENCVSAARTSLPSRLRPVNRPYPSNRRPRASPSAVTFRIFYL